MRVLSVEECDYVSGGAGGGNPIATTFFKTDNGWTASFNGVTTTVVCTTPLSASFGFEMTTKGNIVGISGGAAVTMPNNCIVTTTNTKTGTVLICQGTECVSYDKNGVKVSDTNDGFLGFSGLDDVVPAGGFYEFAGDNGSDLIGGSVGYEPWTGGPGTQPARAHAPTA